MAVYEDVIGGWTDDAGYKPPVRLATTVSLGTSATGLLVIDGVQTVAGDRVLRWQEADQTQNGVWIVNSGAWTRALDFSSSSAILFGTQIYASSGVSFAKSVFICQTQMPAVGTTPITFLLQTAAAAAAPGFRYVIGVATDTATATDGTIAWSSSFVGAKTQNIPGAAAIPKGQSLTIKDSYGDANVNNITITPASGTIEGQASFVMDIRNQSISLQSDGVSNWVIV